MLIYLTSSATELQVKNDLIQICVKTLTLPPPAAGGMAGGMPGATPGGMPDLSQIDFGQMMNNPAFMNMANQFMTDPNMQVTYTNNFFSCFPPNKL